MSMTATARCAGGLRNEIDVNHRHTVVTDEPRSLGGADAGPAPHELLPATIASCVATMVALYGGRRGWEMGDTEVTVTYDSDTTPRHVDVELMLPPGFSAEQRERLEHVARTCPVRRSLEAGFEFDEHTHALDPREAAA